VITAAKSFTFIFLLVFSAKCDNNISITIVIRITIASS